MEKVGCKTVIPVEGFRVMTFIVQCLQSVKDMKKMPNSLDFLGRFKNPALQEEFILYCTQQRPKISFALITLVLLTWAISESILCTWFAEEEPDEKARQLIFGWISLILSFIVLTICILLSFPIFQFQNRFIYSYLQVIFIISINSVFIVKAIKHISFGFYPRED